MPQLLADLDLQRSIPNMTFNLGIATGGFIVVSPYNSCDWVALLHPFFSPSVGSCTP